MADGEYVRMVDGLGAGAGAGAGSGAGAHMAQANRTKKASWKIISFCVNISTVILYFKFRVNYTV